MSQKKWTDEKAVAYLRRFIETEFKARDKFLREPRRTQAMSEAEKALDALSHVNTKLEIESPSLYQQIDLFA